MLKLAVLVSGGGTNLQAIIDSIVNGTITNAEISVVISNNAAFAGGIEFAKKTNMTLAGFVRPPNMTIYAGGHRIRSISR